MRHLYGVALAVLLAAAVFFGAAWGYVLVSNAIGASAAASSGLPAAGGGGLPAAGGSLLQNAHILAGGSALLAVGLAAGLLMVIPRVSPLAAGLPGLVLVAWTALYASDVREAVNLIPLKSRDFGTGFESLLFTGLLGMAGLTMIAPLFIPSRWRSRSLVPRWSSQAPPAFAAAGMGGQDLEATMTRVTMGDAGSDLARTAPQQGPVFAPDGSPERPDGSAGPGLTEP